MFGFLGSPCARCQQDQARLYQSFFCGLSTSLAQHYGPAARFLTNRDATFLSLLGASQREDCPEFEKRTCCNPLARPYALHCSGEDVQYAAAVTLCGIWSKLRDSALDEKGCRRSAALLASTVLTPWKERSLEVLRSRRFPLEQVWDRLEAQEIQERELGKGVDWRESWRELAAPTAYAYGTILEFCTEHPGNREPLREIGQSLGRLAYLLDAVEDYDADYRDRQFNLFQWAGSPAALAETVWETVQEELQAISRAVDATVFQRYEELIQGLLVTGLESRGRDLVWASTTVKRRKKRRERQAGNSNDGHWWSSCCDGATAGCWCPCDDCCAGCSAGEGVASGCSCECCCSGCCSGA